MAKSFAEKLVKLRYYRRKTILTQRQVAKALCVSPPRISEWERGKRTPKPLTQEEIFRRILKARAKALQGA
jgi:transcriptional regulator with XRE-family HTH domain